MKENTPPLSTIEDYMALWPPNIQEKLQQIRGAIREAAPEATEKISYQMPTFALAGTNLVHYAAYKKHIGFYPAPSGIGKFQDQLTGYKHAKGSIQFPIEQPLPLDLIRQIVRFRAEENMKKAQAKRKGQPPKKS